MIGRRAVLAAALLAAPKAMAQKLSLAEGETLRGRFVQQRFLQGFAAPLTSTGSFILAPGRGVVWRGETPFAMTTVMGPAGLVQKVTGGATTHYPASKLPAIAQLYEVFGAALAGDWAKLSPFFSVQRDGAEQAWTVTLMPLRGGEEGLPLSRVVVKGGRYVGSVEVARANGDSDRIEFHGSTPSREPIDRETSELLDTAGRK